MRYDLAAVMHYEQQIEQQIQTVVLCGPAITGAPDRLEAGSITVQVTNVLLGQEDGTLALQRLRQKARRREPFTGADRVDLLLLPLLRHTGRLRALLPDIVEVGLSCIIEVGHPSHGPGGAHHPGGSRGA
jgi:hypothetical protein